MCAELPKLNKRLLDIIDEISNGNVSDFVSKIGLSHQVVNRCLNIDSRNGKYPQPSTDIITAIANNLTLIDIKWLLTGEDKMLKGIDIDDSQAVKIKDMESKIKQLKDVDAKNLQTIKSIGDMEDEFEKLFSGKGIKKYEAKIEKLEKEVRELHVEIGRLKNMLETQKNTEDIAGTA